MKNISADSSTGPSKGLIVAAFLTVYLVWGSTYLGIRFAIESIPPFLMAGTRYFLAGALLYAVMNRKGAPRPSAAEWRDAAIVGSCLLLFGNGGLTIAELHIPSGLAALLIATVPMLMTVFAWWGKMAPRPSLPIWLGLAIGFAGVCLLAKPEPAHHTATANGASHSLGVVVALLSAVIWSIGSLYSRKARVPASPLTMVGMQMLCGGALLLATSLVTGELQSFRLSNVTPHSAWSFLYLLTFGSILGFTAYVWLLQVCEPALVGTYAFVNPVVAVFLGWLLGGEKITVQTGWATICIVAAVALIITFQSREARRATINTEPPEQA